MPEGALLTNTVEAVLYDLAQSRSTGCLLVRDQEGDEAEVFLRDGAVYAVMVPGRRVMLGVRLMSRGALTPEALAEALEIQRTELQGWRLGELLVHLGYVELAVVEEFVVEHLKDALADLLGWPVAAWKFRKNKKTRQDVAPPTSVEDLFDDLRSRATTWETILESIGGPDCVPTLAAGSPSDDVALGPNEWALLCKVDARRSVAALASECGFTLFEAGQVVTRLLEAGLVSIDTAEELEVERPDDAGAELVLPLVQIDDTEGADGSDVVVEAEQVEAEQVEAEQVEQVEQAEAEQVEAEQVDAEQVEAEQVEAEQVEVEQVEVEQVEVEVEVEQVEQVEVEQVEQVEVEQVEVEQVEQAEANRERDAAELHRQLEALAIKEAAAREARAEARRIAREEQEQQAERLAAEAQLAAAEDQAWEDHAGWLADRAAEAADAAAREEAERQEQEAAQQQAARDEAEEELRKEATRRARARAERAERGADDD